LISWLNFKSTAEGSFCITGVFSYLGVSRSVAVFQSATQPVAEMRTRLNWLRIESNGRLLWTWCSITACSAVLPLLLVAGGGTHGTSWPAIGMHLLRLQHTGFTHRSSIRTQCIWKCLKMWANKNEEHEIKIRQLIPKKSKCAVANAPVWLVVRSQTTKTGGI
jgi:hypothetical protein